MKIKFQTGDPLSVAADALIVPVKADNGNAKFDGLAGQIDKALNGELGKLAADAKFTAKPGTRLVVPTLGQLAARRVVLTGLGSGDTVSAETARKAWGAATTAARDAGASKVFSALPTGGDGDLLAAAVQGALAATYRFSTYFGSVKNERAGKQIDSLTFVDPDLSKAATKQAIARGEAVASGVNLARDLTNEPGGVLTPARVAEIAKEVAKAHGLDFEALGPKELAKIGADNMLTVGKGSANAPRLIHLTYRPKGVKKPARSIGIIGKCITFDTGGYSIKPADAMINMHGDMSGGAAVLGAMSALRALDVPFEVHGVICAAENMISGEAFRPHDIIKGMNGVTIEVISTDAEGRLVLADGLVYTARLGVDEMIDLATLTGAKVIALGDQTVALYANDDALANRLLAASETAGEHTWRMPLSEHLEEQIKSEVADIKNTGGRPGGSITGALFIQHFSEGLPWAHLDIAGSNRTTKGNAYTPKGATGIGVRTLLDYLTAPR